jgi:multiple sugar transport system substrate-binding protein
MLASMAMVGSILGCANTTVEEKAPAATPQAKSAEPTKLRIMWWGSQTRHDATLKALELYTKNNPHVTFEPEYSGMDGYLDKLSTQAAAKNAPDIYQLDPSWVADWIARKQLADLSSMKLDKVDPKLLQAGKSNNVQYAVPLGSVAYGMIYDKAALEKLGLTAPKNDWTWDDFFALAKGLKGKAKEGQYFSKDYAGDYFAYSAYQYAQGKGMLITDEGKFNIDKDTFLKWTKQFEELRKEGLVPPADVNASDKEFDPTGDLMVNGKVLIRLSFSNNFSAWDSIKPGTYALVTMPRNAEAGGWLKPSMYFGISADSKKAEEAKKFVEWFLNDMEAAKILTTQRGVPVNNEIAAALEPNFSVPDKVGMQLYNATLKDGQTYSPGPRGWTAFVDKDFATVRDELSFGKITPEQAYDKLKSFAEGYKK